MNAARGIVSDDALPLCKFQDRAEHPHRSCSGAPATSGLPSPALAGFGGFSSGYVRLEAFNIPSCECYGGAPSDERLNVAFRSGYCPSPRLTA